RRMKCKLKRIFTLLIVFIWLLVLLSYFQAPKVQKNTILASSTLDETSYISKTKLSESEDPYHRHKFNQQISDELDSDRPIPDTRPPQCLEESYDKRVSSTSIIITFHNEARSALLRTIKSVLDRTPPRLLMEIILVDDFSANEKDGALLKDLPKIVLMRNDKREGLIRSRLKGVSVAKSSILTFLDSHCEVNVGWIEPLLAKVEQDPLAIASPVIDIIKTDTLEYKASSNYLKGGFDWNMHFIWEPLLEKEMKEQKADSTHPISTPVIAGGVFAVQKQWFNQLGQYDSLLEIWGAENFEISFKTWMCGGSLKIIPCSRVGHIFRKSHPYEFPLGNGHTYLMNVRRVAEVWMDRYKRIFYRARGGNMNEPLPRIKERRLIRERLKCRPFDWYLMEVYPELRVPNVDELAYGEIKQIYKGQSYCLSESKTSKVLAVKCIPKDKKMQWVMSVTGMIQNEKDKCLYASKKRKRISLKDCDNSDFNQHWKFMIRERLRHQATNLCIERKSDGSLLLARCENFSPQQKWSFTTKFLF
uniref:Polypeptide N-acetylgalactosaminyltransferase n=1 Tax=Clytia hemisphaerica TaxID=252671 RepID=A0A7M5V2U5_9CNID